MAVDCSLDELCRICIRGGSKKMGTVPVFSKEGEANGLLEKISRFLFIQISEEDRLPKVVCADCASRLNSFEDFQLMALKSQETLLDLRKAFDDNENVDIEEFLSEKNNESSWWTSSNETAGSGSEESEVDPASLVTTTDDFSEDFSSKSLLHTILTKGQNLLASEVTEMEVTVDPMLFFEEDEDEEDSSAEAASRSTTGNNSNTGADSTQISDPKPYQCYMCPRGFNSDLSLKSHLWNHIPSRRVLATSDLNRHETEGSLRTRMFNSQCLCTECGRVYPSKSTLRAHQITHSDLRPHKCSLCDKTFKRNQDLKFHINQHTGERPYRCPYCPKAFASSGNCFSHRKRMHPKQLARDKKKNRR